MKDKSLIESGFTSGGYKNVHDLLKKIILMTFCIELSGAILMYFQFTFLSGGDRVFASIFHAISAFCNAGFSTFSNNLENFTSHVGVNTVIMLLIIFGGIGFVVQNEMLLLARRKIKSFSKFTLHTKMVIITTTILIFGGGLVIFLEEVFNKQNTLPLGSKILASLFQSVSARTAGFNTINLNTFSLASIFILIILMFIGASPGSTGGGIKTTSFSMIMIYFRSRLMGKEKTDVFYRNIPPKTTEKSFIVAIISILLISTFVFLLLTFQDNALMVDVVFEIVSAFGTVGLSKGLTPQLSNLSKLIVVLTMYIGRIGPLTLLLAVSRKESKAVVKFPEEEIMIG